MKPDEKDQDTGEGGDIMEGREDIVTPDDLPEVEIGSEEGSPNESLGSEEGMEDEGFEEER